MSQSTCCCHECQSTEYKRQYYAVHYSWYIYKDNLYPSYAPGLVRPFKIPSYECTVSGMLQSLKCSVHSYRGLKISSHSLSPHYVMVCGQSHVLVTLPNYVHMQLMNRTFQPSCNLQNLSIFMLSK